MSVFSKLKSATSSSNLPVNKMYAVTAWADLDSDKMLGDIKRFTQQYSIPMGCSYMMAVDDLCRKSKDFLVLWNRVKKEKIEVVEIPYLMMFDKVSNPDDLRLLLLHYGSEMLEEKLHKPCKGKDRRFAYSVRSPTDFENQVVIAYIFFFDG